MSSDARPCRSEKDLVRRELSAKYLRASNQGNSWDMLVMHARLHTYLNVKLRQPFTKKPKCATSFRGYHDTCLKRPPKHDACSFASHLLVDTRVASVHAQLNTVEHTIKHVTHTVKIFVRRLLHASLWRRFLCSCPLFTWILTAYDTILTHNSCMLWSGPCARYACDSELGLDKSRSDKPFFFTKAT